jgi:AcrR family transcriptional regulator
LIAATEPLLERFGREVSTRQIAEAACVAEGTIFRAFPTKEALIDAVLDDVFAVESTCERLARIDRSLPLERRLTVAVEVLQRRMRKVIALFHSMRVRSPGRHDPSSLRNRQHQDNAKLNAALADLLSADADRLRLDLDAAADALRSMTFALCHPLFGREPAGDPEQVVDLVLHGILSPERQG